MDEILMNWKLNEIIDSWGEEDHTPTPSEEMVASILLLIESHVDDLLILSKRYARADAAAVAGIFALHTMSRLGVSNSVQSNFIRKLRLAACRLFDVQTEVMEKLMHNRLDVFFSLIRSAKGIAPIAQEAALLFAYDLKYDSYVEFHSDSPVILLDLSTQLQIEEEAQLFFQAAFTLVLKSADKYGPLKAKAPASQQAVPRPAAASSPRPSPAPASPRNSVGKLIDIRSVGLVVAVTLVLLIWLCLGSGSRAPAAPVTPQETARQTVETTAPKLVARATPANGHVFERIGLKEFAPFSVSAPSGGGIYVVMDPISFIDPENLELYSSQQLGNKVNASELRFFVRANCTAELDVPLGRYRVYYATGDTWYGEEHLFGPDTLYYKCDDEFAFTSDSEGYNGWTLTLTAVYNGNLDTDLVDESDFPK